MQTHTHTVPLLCWIDWSSLKRCLLFFLFYSNPFHFNILNEWRRKRKINLLKNTRKTMKIAYSCQHRVVDLRFRTAVCLCCFVAHGNLIWMWLLLCSSISGGGRCWLIYYIIYRNMFVTHSKSGIASYFFSYTHFIVVCSAERWWVLWTYKLALLQRNRSQPTTHTHTHTPCLWCFFMDKLVQKFNRKIFNVIWNSIG